MATRKMVWWPWFVLVLLLFQVPSSDSRRLPQEQLRETTRLCDEEAISDSLISSTATLFGGFRSLLTETDDHVVVENSHAPPTSSQHDQESRANLGKELLTNLASTSSVPSGGDQLTVEKRNRSPPSFPSESEILNDLGKGTPPRGPSGSNHLTVEKRHRSPPTSISESEILNNLGKGTPPRGPSGPNHLTVEKRQRTPPPRPSTDVSESGILNNLGKGSSPSSPSGGNHLVAEKRSHRSPPAFGSELRGNLAGSTSSTPSCCNHLVVDESKQNRETAAVDSEEGIRNRETLMKRASTSTPSADDDLVGEPFQKLDSVPSGPNHLVVENMKRERSAPPSPTRPKSPQSEHTDTSLDAGQEVGCSDSIWGSFENMVQQFAKSFRHIAVVRSQ